MKARPFVSLSTGLPLTLCLGLGLLVSGCSSDAEDGTGGGGAGATTATTSATGGAGGGVDPYEAAVRSASWVKLDAGPKVGGGAKQDDIYFLDAMHGFAASGPKGAVLETKDGGASWNTVLSQPGAYFRAVLFTDSQHGFAGNIGAGLAASIDDPTLVYETKDGGVSWDPITTISGSEAKGICNFTATDALNIIGIGRANGPSHMIQSSDGGATWISKDLTPWFRMAIDAHFSSPSEGVVAGMDKATSRCAIMRTTDGGANFEPVFTSSTPGSLCWKLDFPTPLLGYAAVQDTTSGPGTFAKTEDGGQTWVELPLPAPADKPKQKYPAIGIGFINEKIGWVVSEDPDLPSYRTFDGGLNWELEPNLEAPINRFRFIDEHTAYAIGAAVWKLEVPSAQP